MLLRILMIFCLCFFAVPLRVLAEGEMFPFVVSYESPKNVTNMSSRLVGPAGKNGFVRIEGEKFVDDQGELRFWATNLSGMANFPSHEMAERTVDRLAKCGFNCVRLHWMDAWDIFGGRNSKNLTDFDPARIDNLDYMIAAVERYFSVHLCA